ncbi:sigma-70 family RNA polymerase sigma factor [Pseudoflavitalea sp. X16]|uniref:RNA polymerase sigma factor n=1 Tax=Paraflavitalea devenefica TaxID=2716334 RepID=UPI00141F7F78|nr:sigma-70 family RNA polymerase sigma factor [Paraflavitalea devenefica]NII28844.1 sigma-70 family RNA polymerase sigma factor [Paraflavitalea devenefica]
MNQHALLIHDEKEAAFNELYHAYWEFLFRLACKKTGSTDDAADLIHDLFTDIWKNFHHLPAPDAIRSYLVSALYHKVFNYFRSKGLQEKHYKSFESFLAQQAPANEYHLTEEEKEKWNSIDRAFSTALTGMPGKMKDIFIRNVYQEQSIDQIASDLLLSRQTVKNQLHLASKRLRVACKRVYSHMFGLLF